MTCSRLPVVNDSRLFLPDGAKEQLAFVVVGSDAWYAWLSDPKSSPFRSGIPLAYSPPGVSANGIAGTGMPTASVQIPKILSSNDVPWHSP